MEEEDDPGMGVVKRRRSRRLLEARKVAATPSQERITTESAAAAWGDMLVGPPADPPPEPPPRSSGADRPARGDTPLPKVPTDPPRAPLRGVPLSSRPPSAMPPDGSLDEAPSDRPARPDPPRSRPPDVRVPERRTPATGVGVTLMSVRRTDAAQPDTGPPARQAPPDVEGFEPPRARMPSVPVASLPPEPPTAPAERTLEVPAPTRRRPLWMDLTLAVLLLAAGVWTAAVLFDDMGRTDRLDRVGRALSTAGQRMVREHPDLPLWLGARPDPVAVKSLKDKEIPRLVEAVAAAGYATGVFTVAVGEDPDHTRLVLEARVPDAVVAYGTDGHWVHAPPPGGLVAALGANAASILGSFALPLVAWIGFLIARKRRAAG